MAQDSSEYDVVVVFLSRFEPDAVGILKLNLARLCTLNTGEVPSIALIEKADGQAAGFCGLGFSSIIIGLYSVNFAANAVQQLLRSPHQMPPGISIDRDPQACAGECEEQAQVSPAPHVLSFTCRELELLKLLRRGMQNKIIAYKLGISQSTVKAHLRSIMMKLNAKNRTQAIYLMQDAERTKEAMHT